MLIMFRRKDVPRILDTGTLIKNYLNKINKIVII